MLKNEPFLWEGDAKLDHACLLLHGLGGGIYEMQLLGQVLHQQGYTVQGINYPGHDRPATKMPASTWQQWYGHVLQTYQQLKQRYAAVTVIGFSTGCPLALYLAANQDVQQLVLLSPYLAIRHQWYYVLRAEAYLFSLGMLIHDVPRFNLPIQDLQMRELAHEVAFFRTFNLPSVRSANELIQQVKLRLPDITEPTLIIQSRQDTVVDPQGAEVIYQQIGSPVKKLVWLERSDHIIPLDQEREMVFAQVSQFLQRQELSQVSA